MALGKKGPANFLVGGQCPRPTDTLIRLGVRRAAGRCSPATSMSIQVGGGTNSGLACGEGCPPVVGLRWRARPGLRGFHRPGGRPDGRPADRNTPRGRERRSGCR